MARRANGPDRWRAPCATPGRPILQLASPRYLRVLPLPRSHSRFARPHFNRSPGRPFYLGAPRFLGGTVAKAGELGALGAGLPNNPALAGAARAVLGLPRRSGRRDAVFGLCLSSRTSRLDRAPGAQRKSRVRAPPDFKSKSGAHVCLSTRRSRNPAGKINGPEAPVSGIV